MPGVIGSYVRSDLIVCLERLDRMCGVIRSYIRRSGAIGLCDWIVCLERLDRMSGVIGSYVWSDWIV